MRVLDLCCGAGGASEGFARAGMQVVGVDNKRQPSYRHRLVVLDAREALRTLDRSMFDLVHASPPCERYSRGAMQAGTTEDHPDLIGELRELLIEWGLPFVIENIDLARPLLREPIMLCGTMFGLGVFRHRWFEVNGFTVAPPPHPEHTGKIGDGTYVTVTGKPGGRSNADGWEGASTDEWRRAMDISWMSSREIVKAIPPAYTEFIARQFLHTPPTTRSSMGINAPHPNEADEAAAFFGEPDEPEPAVAQAEDTSDTRSELERKEDAYQYALSHGEPISEELNAAHEQHQREAAQAQQDTEFEAAAPQAAPQSDGERAAEIAPDPNDNLRAIAEREREVAESKVEAEHEAAAEAQAEPQPEPEPDPTSPTPTDGSPAGTTEPTGEAEAQVSEASGEAEAQAQAAKKSGDLSREYIVFRKLGLNKRVLEGLLKRIEDGVQEELVAWIEVERLEARNVVGAVSGTYTKHQERLGGKVDLAAVSSRSFQVKHVEPKQVVQSNLSIT